MPYLTPDSIPEDDNCRPLSIPASSDWLAIVSGALTELIKTYNWEQRGSVTVEEAVARMQTMIDDYYAGCVACTLPGGGSAIRVRADGHIEELLPDGTWGEPTGDYVLPPVEAREGGTEDDQICLAARNAANVLQLLYENISDSYADGLDDAEALTAFIEFVIVTIGVAFAPIAFAIAMFLLPIFAIAYIIVEEITADLWDESVTQAITCILIDCASNDAGVVTFDWDCFQRGLINEINDFALLPDQLRLFAQIQIMLQIIGGVDALNLAGNTTAITDDDCSFCPETWCYTWDFLHSSHSGDGFQVAPGFTGYGEWVDSNGWYGAPSPDSTPGLVLALEGIAEDTEITSVHIDGKTVGGSGWFVQTYFRNDGSTVAHPDMTLSWAAGHELYDADITGSWSVDELWFNPVGGTSAAQYIFNITLRGTGTNPFGDDNC